MQVNSGFITDETTPIIQLVNSEFITDETTPIIQLIKDFRGSRMISASRLFVGGVIDGVGFCYIRT